MKTIRDFLKKQWQVTFPFVWFMLVFFIIKPREVNMDRFDDFMLGFCLVCFLHAIIDFNNERG